MNRINIYTCDDSESETYAGWFDKDASTIIASHRWGDLYVSGKVLLSTASDKFIVNEWNNTGYDDYRFAENDAEIAEILSAGGYSGDSKKLTEILEEY